MAQRRTTHRSAKGTKLYAVRKADGTFDDIQTYKRAHAADLRASATDETSAKSKTALAAKSAKKMPGKPAAKSAPTPAKTVTKSSGIFARAKKAVGDAVKRVTSKKAPAKVAAAPARPAAKKAASKKGRKAA